eukprot:16479-Heterococcus_DN1.PRE.1
MAFSKIIVAAIALMLASASAFMPAPSAALRATAVRSSAPHCSLRMSAGGDGSNPSHEEYVEKAKAWAAKNTHLSDAEIESSIKEGKHLVEQVYGSSHDVRKEGQAIGKRTFPLSVCIQQCIKHGIPLCRCSTISLQWSSTERST